jgi:beta-glucanase (GH16 family)
MRTARLSFVVLCLAVLLGALTLPAHAQTSADYTQGVTSVSSTQARWWFKANGFTAGYVILHYTPAGLSQQNVNAVYNAGTAQWEYTVSGLSSGMVIPYHYSYQKNGVQYESANFSYTHSGAATPTVVVYQDCNYGGTSGSFPIGSYTLAAMQARGVPNDWVSSVRVPAGLKVVLYQNDNYAGTSVTLTADNSCLVGNSFNDQASSMVVSSAGGATPTTPPRATATATTAARSTATATAAARSTATPTPSGGWTLVWSDEFNGTGAPSSANWNYHVGNGYNPGLPGFQGWGNGEWEWYRPENSYQSGGNLVIRADYNTTPTNIAGRDWYQRSGRLTTQGKHSWTYGKIEARIQMPNAIGSWPAFWMMGDSSGGTSTSNYTAPITYYDSMATNWASCGEVDMMEHKNSDTIIYNNIFWDLRTGVFPWTAGQNANYGTTYTVGNVAQFHVYSLEWDATYMKWFTDGVQTHIIDITPATLEEFHKPFYLILNLAVGGAFPAADPNAANFPLYMYVDYVRVYQK